MMKPYHEVAAWRMAITTALCVGVVSWAPAQTAPELRGARLFKSGPIQITADGSAVWAVNPDNDSVTRIETASGQAREFVLPAAEGPHAPKGLSVKEDGAEVWVACHDSDRVYVLEGVDGAVRARIELPWGSGAYSIALAPDQQKALVTLHRAAGVAVLDVPGRKLRTVLEPVFWAPMGIAWAEQGQAAWVNHIFAPGEHPLETRIDFSGSEPKVTTAIRITPADPRQSSRLTAPYNVAEGGYLNVRGHGAQIPAASGRNELWLPTQYHNFTEDIFTPDSTIQSAVRHIDLSRRGPAARRRGRGTEQPHAGLACQHADAGGCVGDAFFQRGIEFSRASHGNDGDGRDAARRGAPGLDCDAAWPAGRIDRAPGG